MSEKNGSTEQKKEMVEFLLDGNKVSIPAGTNLIEAAAAAGVAIPHYCYHKDLSIAGNCRMCQVHIKGKPKLEIACNTIVQNGMEVQTQVSNPAVKSAQEATLEFILINHPLDCTVCDQSGHCKLQDYHYDYNAKPSRFIEEKIHKVKAEPLGPNVILDGERCIMCTRCIRFCDEVTGTSELGMINRGDRSVITVNEGKELNNALSGTVVDLCPVGALTHRNWRFNSRIWYTNQKDSICTGCSTGCNVKVAVRDNEVVHVKARYNENVNKEWMCDEGRYSFNNFTPKSRITSARVGSNEVELNKAIESFKPLKGQELLVFISPDLTLEEYWLLKKFLERDVQKFKSVLAHRERKLSDVEKILISPDYASNFRAAQLFGLCGENLEEEYLEALKSLREGSVENILIVGDRGILKQDLDVSIIAGISKCKVSIGLLADANSALCGPIQTIIPERTVLEKAGLMVNRKMRLQFMERLLDCPTTALPVWKIVNMAAAKLGVELVNCTNDRELTLRYIQSDSRLSGLKIGQLKEGGVSLTELHEGKHSRGQTSAGAV
ncbi:MAG: 2Fe-2S iron-sulfur cluster-binding protein [bacterium]|nr:2Fe-2S iron-sulfur cluster-binding protein [bacterium]